MNEIKKEDVQLMHSALSGFHSTIVSTRFAVAGLYIAASAFLIQAVFVDGNLSSSQYIIATFGLLLTIALWLLEIRNINLLENIDNRGQAIETEFNLEKESCFGFFWLMDDQSIAPKLPFIPSHFKFSRFPYKGKAKTIVRYIISHSFGLSLVYLSGTLFWIIILLK